MRCLRKSKGMLITLESTEAAFARLTSTEKVGFVAGKIFSRDQKPDDIIPDLKTEQKNENLFKSKFHS